MTIFAESSHCVPDRRLLGRRLLRSPSRRRRVHAHPHRAGAHVVDQHAPRRDAEGRRESAAWNSISTASSTSAIPKPLSTVSCSASAVFGGAGGGGDGGTAGEGGGGGGLDGGIAGGGGFLQAQHMTERVESPSMSNLPQCTEASPPVSTSVARVPACAAEAPHLPRRPADALGERRRRRRRRRDDLVHPRRADGIRPRPCRAA